MGILSGLVAPIGAASSYPADHDFWYASLGTSYGGQSLTGLRISEDTAMMASAVWACVRLISESLATVPLLLYRRLPDDRRERAGSHYLFSVLHDQPNDYQTAFEFREMMTAHCLLTGNAYARLVSGRSGAADQLLPMHPNRMTISTVGDTIQYRYIEPNGGSSVYLDDEIFHLRGLSNGGALSSQVGYNADGRLGMSVLQYARESIGLTLATEQFGSRRFSQDARPGGVLEHPGKLTTEAKQRLKASWEEAHTGLNNAHRVAVLEEGMKWQTIGLSNEDAQFLQSRQFQIAEIARWFRVPLHMIQEASGSTSWGSGLEQLSGAFVIYTLLPWARRWEQAIQRDLITQSDLYAEYLFDALLRGDSLTRAQALQIRFQNGTLNADEWRRIENSEPLPDEQGEKYYIMANMKEVGAPEPEPPPAPPAQPPMPAPAESATNTAHYWLVLRSNAARLVRKEITVMSKAATKWADNPNEWCRAVDEFYAGHAETVADVLQIGRSRAAQYAFEQQAMLKTYGAGAMEDWEPGRVEWLMLLAAGPLAA